MYRSRSHTTLSLSNLDSTTRLPPEFAPRPKPKETTAKQQVKQASGHPAPLFLHFPVVPQFGLPQFGAPHQYGTPTIERQINPLVKHRSAPSDLQSARAPVPNLTQTIKPRLFGHVDASFVPSQSAPPKPPTPRCGGSHSNGQHCWECASHTHSPHSAESTHLPPRQFSSHVQLYAPVNATPLPQPPQAAQQRQSSIIAAPECIPPVLPSMPANPGDDAIVAGMSNPQYYVDLMQTPASFRPGNNDSMGDLMDFNGLAVAAEPNQMAARAPNAHINPAYPYNTYTQLIDMALPPGDDLMGTETPVLADTNPVYGNPLMYLENPFNSYQEALQNPFGDEFVSMHDTASVYSDRGAPSVASSYSLDNMSTHTADGYGDYTMGYDSQDPFASPRLPPHMTYQHPAMSEDGSLANSRDMTLEWDEQQSSTWENGSYNRLEGEEESGGVGGGGGGTVGISTRLTCPFSGCIESFASKADQEAHIAGHNAGKPHPCPDCHLCFRRNHDLKRHMRLHNNERPYVCPLCGKGFARSDALKRHTSHGDECITGELQARAKAKAGMRVLNGTLPRKRSRLAMGPVGGIPPGEPGGGGCSLGAKLAETARQSANLISKARSAIPPVLDTFAQFDMAQHPQLAPEPGQQRGGAWALSYHH